MENPSRIRATGISCITGAIVWIIALFIEYGLGLQPPGSGGLFYLKQAMFLVAMVGFLMGIVGLMWARAAGDGWSVPLPLWTGLGCDKLTLNGY